MDRTFIYSATEAFIYEILYVYVTEFAKTIPNRTRTEIKFIAEH